MNKDHPKSEAAKLREEAEKRLRASKKHDRNASMDEDDLQKLIHELQVHHIELQIQNDELIKALEKAEIAEEKYIKLFDFAPSGYIALSKEGTIIELNFSASSLLGKERAQLIRSSFAFFVSPPTRSVFNTFFERVFTSNKTETCEVELLVGDSPPIIVHLIGIYKEKSEQCLLTLINITDRKLMDLLINKQNSELTKLLEDKDRFMSVLAHDLKGPFASIVGLTELLRKNITQFDAQKIELISNLLIQSAKNSSALLDDLLLWANAQSGKLSFEPKRIKLSKVFKDIQEIFDPIAKEKSIQITYPEEDNLFVFADTNMLKVILRNLISNAIKFTNNGGEIHIDTHQDDQETTIIVTDNGIGIEPQYMDKLFSASNLFSTKGTNNESGSGLGLVLCREFVKRHMGLIWVESKPGKGSSFHFALPQSGKYSDKKVINWTEKKILFADDEFATYILFSSILKSSNANIEYAQDGKTAVELSKNNNYDLIMMDINMPKMNGFEATAEIRRFNSDITIIAHTCNVLKRDDCIAAGFTDYIMNSGNQDNLMRLLNNYLG